MKDMVRCPLCEVESTHHVPISHRGEMRKCSSCRFVFAFPNRLPEPPEILFQRAYRGEHEVARMDDFHKRLMLKKDLQRIGLNPRKALLFAQREAVRYLEGKVAKGSVVFDIGCGTGSFMTVIGRLGYRPFGLEVAEDMVNNLKDDGYPVWHGNIETLPEGWVQPQVCTSFFVLHHLPDPMGLLTTVRDRFPKATLLVAEHNNLTAIKNKGAASPPRCFSWWGPSQLRLALEKAEYEVEIRTSSWPDPDYTLPLTAGPYFTMRRSLPRSWMLRLLSLYYRTRPLFFFPLASYAFLLQRRSSILAIGRPR